MSKLGLCPLCGSIMLGENCCGCDGKEKKQETKVKEVKKKEKEK